MKGSHEQKGAGPKGATMLWACFALGIACIAFGIEGMWMEYDQGSLLSYISWMGSEHAPTFRGIEIVCLGLGAALAYRAWSRF